MTAKHATASTYVLSWHQDCWRIGLIAHPLFGLLTVPGGHVEPDETAAEAAVRETAEEAGLAVRLLRPPAEPLPAGVAGVRQRMPSPWWILEQPVPRGDNHLAGPHVHVDHLYVAIAESPEPVTAPGHPFGWYTAADLPGLEMFPDTRLIAGYLLAGEASARIAGLARQAAAGGAE